MGGTSSKYPATTHRDEGALPEETQTTPISTPRTRTLDFDPRSPSTNICRTPIEVPTTPLSEPNLTQDTFNINSPVINKVLLDPRSPSVQFTRTPLIVPGDKPERPLLITNKNLSNVLNIEGMNSLHRQRSPMPRLLESTPIKNRKSELPKRKSFAGLLETNLDFVETNLDEVIFRKSMYNLCDSHIDCEPNRTDADIEAQIGQVDVAVHELSVVDNGDGLITPVQSPADNIDAVTSIVRDIIDDVFKIDDIKLEILPRIMAASSKPRKMVENFDKKITNLIYEDEQLGVRDVTESADEVKPKHEVKNRTPLADRNGQSRKKCASSKLKVSDKPRKGQYAVSKIPMYRDKRVSKASNQCENTPPVKNKNKSMWDQQDNTLVI